MARTILGITLATLALYVWGMLYWGFNPLPYTSWGRVADDEAAGRALLEHFPASGTYYVPGLYNDDDTIARLHEQGPVAFVHVTAREGRPRNEPTVLVKGFVLDAAVVTLIAILLRLAAPAAPRYGQRLPLALVAGLAGVVLIDLGDTVWWYLALDWKLYQAAYDLSAWAVAGSVLAAFVRES